MRHKFVTFALLIGALLIALLPKPSGAQTSWWDQYASPAARAADAAYCAKNEPPRTIVTKQEALPYIGPVAIHGAHHCETTGLIKRTVNGSYILETREGYQNISEADTHKLYFDVPSSRCRH